MLDAALYSARCLLAGVAQGGGGCFVRRFEGDWNSASSNRRHKKTLNLAIQGFRYLVPETE